MSPPPSTEGEEAFWLDVLRAQGVSDAEIGRARAEGSLELFAVERYILDEPLEFDVEQAAASSGIDAAKLRGFWRALGFPDPQSGEATFSASDVEMLRTVLQYIDAALLDETVALQMARVIGSSLARVATAQVEAADLQGGGLSQLDTDAMTDEERASEVRRSAELIPILSVVIQSVWRRHLASAARSRIMRDADAPRSTVAVGFADLEGFTSLSQQLPEHELAELVNRFEQLAYDTIASVPGARMVKMIGDEVMFTTDSVAAGAELALKLAEAYGADDALGDVRVGLASGHALKLEGDLYGPPVNLASRIVSVAYPGSVVVSAEVHEELDGHADFRFRSIRSHHLRHIGRVRLWRLVRPVDDVPEAPDGEDRTLRRARDRRAARRLWIADRMADRLADLAAETAGDVTDRAVRRIIGGPTTPEESEAGETSGRDEVEPDTSDDAIDPA